MSGIVTYGSYIPKYRIKPEEIARVWGENPENIKNGIYILSKSVPAPDEDVATISVEAARNALKRKAINPKDIGAIYVGSESHPYAVKPTATIVGSALGVDFSLFAADYEFACKAGTAGMQNVKAMVDSGMIKYGLAIGSDTSQGAPGDALEYSASAGGTGAAKMLGFEEKQYKDGLLTPFIGNTYSGSMMTGLSSILDISKPGDHILAVSFGSGAGADAFDITVNDEIESMDREKAPTIKKMLDNVKWLDYAVYAKYKKKIVVGEGIE